MKNTNTSDERTKEARELAQKLIVGKKKAKEEAKYAMNDPKIRAVVEKLKKRNQERGTPIVKI